MIELTEDLTLEELLEDLGLELYTEGVIKLPLYVSFYEGGEWTVDSVDLQTGASHTTLGDGKNLIKILPVLREIRDLFLKRVKEINKEERTKFKKEELLKIKILKEYQKVRNKNDNS